MFATEHIAGASNRNRTPESRSEATEALGGLVEAIALTPDQAGESLQIELTGNLAAMPGATVQTNRSSESDDLSLQISLVAGAGLDLQLLKRG